MAAVWVEVLGKQNRITYSAYISGSQVTESDNVILDFHDYKASCRLIRRLIRKTNIDGLTDLSVYKHLT